MTTIFIPGKLDATGVLLSMEHEEGYYWIRSRDPRYPYPFIAEWSDAKVWFICGVSATYRDDEVEVLSSRLILPTASVYGGGGGGSYVGATMADENDVRKQDRAEEKAVTDRITDVVSDLGTGKVGTYDRSRLGDALGKANTNASVGRAIRRHE